MSVTALQLRKWRKENPEKVRAYQLKWNKKKPKLFKLNVVKQWLRQYGLTIETWEALKRKHKCCAICRSKAKLDIDHCHQSKRVRGLLCRKCNLALGLFKDNARIVIRAANYLRSKK